MFSPGVNLFQGRTTRHHYFTLSGPCESVNIRHLSSGIDL